MQFNENEEGAVEDDDEPFINSTNAIEVAVDDDIPMDDDDDDEHHEGVTPSNTTKEANTNASDSTNAPSTIPDMSMVTITSHSGPVYTIDAHYYCYTTDQQGGGSSSLRIVTGGGDDRSYLHTLTPSSSSSSDTTPTVQTVPLSHPHTDTVSCVALNTPYVSEDERKTPGYVAVGSYDGSIVLYDAKDGKKGVVLDGPTDVEFVAFHPKGGSVLLAGSIADATVWMYHLPTSKCLQVFVGHENSSNEEEGGGGGGGVTTGAFTPDGRWVVTGGMDGTVRLWAPRTGTCKHVFHLSNTGGGTGTAAGDGYGNMGGGSRRGDGVMCLGLNGGKDGQLVICGGDAGNAYVLHLQGKKVIATLPHSDGVRPSAPTNTNNTNSGNDGMDLDDRMDEEDGNTTSVEAVGFAPHGVNPNWAATGGSDGVLKVWDLTHGVAQCRQICKLLPPPPTPSSPDENEKHNPNNTNHYGSYSSGGGGITKLVWHPTIPLIFVAYTDGIVRLWDARNGRLVHSLTGGGNSSIDNDDNQINDFSVRFVDVGSGSAGSAVVVTANDNGTVKVFKVDVQAVLMTVMGGS